MDAVKGGRHMLDELLGRHFVSLFLILLFSIRLSSQKTSQDHELRYFWMTVLSCLLLVVEDLVELDSSLRPEMRFWRTLSSAAGYVLRSTATLGLVLVVCRPEQRRIGLWIPWIVNLLVCCTAFFTDWAFGFDEEYRFYRGPLGYVSFAVPILYLLALLWMTFQRYNGAGDGLTDRLTLLGCAVLCLSSALLDALRGGVRLHEAILISSFMFYVFLRSCDARRDPLTRLLNRQSMYDDFAGRFRYVTAAVSLDMNGLKRLNDTYGHQAGDEALKEVGGILIEAVGRQTRAYRVGGDEFVMLFYRQEEAKVQETLERIQEKASGKEYGLAYGYAMRRAEDNPDSLLHRADMEMYGRKAEYYKTSSHDRRSRDRRLS